MLVRSATQRPAKEECSQALLLATKWNKHEYSQRSAVWNISLLIAGPHLAGTGDAVVMGTQLQQTRMEVDLIAAPLQHRTAKIVMKNHARRAHPGLKGVDMAAQEVLHGLVEEKLQIQRSRVGQGNDKAGQTSAGASDPDFAKVRPVDLRLLGGKHMQT